MWGNVHLDRTSRWQRPWSSPPFDQGRPAGPNPPSAQGASRSSSPFDREASVFYSFASTAFMSFLISGYSAVLMMTTDTLPLRTAKLFMLA